MENIELAKYLEYTNLHHQATRKQISKLVNDAIEYNMGGVCVAPCWVSYVKNKLEGTGIPVITVPNWKIGGGIEQLCGIADYCFEQCDEVDYIWNAYKFGDLKAYDEIEKELAVVRKFTKGKLKIIIEAYYLRVADEKIHKMGMDKVIKKACELVNKSGADYIKTDSGLFQRPDSESMLEDSTLMVKYSKVPVKSAGGVKTRYDVERLIEAGVKRVGTSNGVAIIKSNVDVRV